MELDCPNTTSIATSGPPIGYGWTAIPVDRSVWSNWANAAWIKHCRTRGWPLIVSHLDGTNSYLTLLAGGSILSPEAVEVARELITQAGGTSVVNGKTIASRTWHLIEAKANAMAARLAELCFETWDA